MMGRADIIVMVDTLVLFIGLGWVARALIELIKTRRLLNRVTSALKQSTAEIKELNKESSKFLAEIIRLRQIAIDAMRKAAVNEDEILKLVYYEKVK